MSPRFIERSNERKVPENYQGTILVWDIDKTYLDTHFSSMRGLMRIPLELAVDKQAVPSAAALLRALRHGPDIISALTPLYFISGSPFQLRKTIERKMTLDGVEFDGITFKDQWGLFRAGRRKYIRAQIGYKLKSLLLYRQEVTDSARWLLFGDDTEYDAQAFLLFGEVCAGLRHFELQDRLHSLKVSHEEIEEILELSKNLPITPDPVDGVFIHLAQKSDPGRFGDPRVVATYSYLQTALVLAKQGYIRQQSIAACAKALRRRMISESEIQEYIVDAKRRFHIPSELVELAHSL